MIVVRPAEERGRARFDWLDSRHSFSFGHYFDPRHMGFRTLRVINEDRVAPGGGFPTHSHRDMEIVSYILSGALEHRDTLGNGSVIAAGDVQRMSAGTGIAHSEFNASPDEPVHFLQIWIEPRERGLSPGYEERRFAVEEKRNRLRPIATPDGRDGSLRLHQDAIINAAILEDEHSLVHEVAEGRHVWVQVARGRVSVNGQALNAGDGAAFSDETRFTIKALDDEAELLLFDLA